jgi:hypothetical protein
MGLDLSHLACIIDPSTKVGPVTVSAKVLHQHADGNAVRAVVRQDDEAALPPSQVGTRIIIRAGEKAELRCLQYLAARGRARTS